MRKLLFTSSILVLTSLVSCNTKVDTQNDNEHKVTPTLNVAEKNKDNNDGKIIHLSQQDFLKKVMNYEKNPNQWVFEGDKPCVIDFYADWCRPCKIASPILEELALEYAGQINFYKIDTQQERELAGAFGIQSIPAILFCPMEGKPQMSSGIAQTPEETKEMFKKLINDLLL